MFVNEPAFYIFFEILAIGMNPVYLFTMFTMSHERMISFVFNKIIPVIALCILITSPAGAKEPRAVKHLPSPNWVHPENRAAYPGYERQKQNKRTGRDWQHSTNRPNGNIRGGGTTEYKDYLPFYTPNHPKRKK